MLRNGETDHRTNVVRPDLVPVSGDRGTGGDGARELESTRGTVIVASNPRGSSILDGVAKSVISEGGRKREDNPHYVDQGR